LSRCPADHRIQRIQYNLSGFGILHIAIRSLSPEP
jgi:hypothetical protein